ncbi:sulfite reductase (NADPH) flavoprotein alpha-component [Paenibacillus shirakamiensis]|uniref:Sulfite reductase (NADPH) flavoprotein alpha-component n=1 Tax=Paenibacillus shirakamiensis TaxID=1265935 RepID=A0ABS4JEZ5_9BACL|nr:assimilatory sulfite reductase (NADPH) flavoprotein subunit [Paenibacillus shirakamiensis]MBP2000286.1 sulfite reductase (NADPH) flavoprotein alpha-component [Paenibacillus shirakamiensis]
MELQVTNSPFNQEQVELLNRLLPTLVDSQRIWLGGYLAAIQYAGIGTNQNAVLSSTVAGDTAPAASAIPVSQSSTQSKSVTVVFGSQTGNSDALGKKVAKKLEAQGFEVTVSSMGSYKTGNLKKVENLLIVVSTQGEGEPPDNAIPFYEFLFSKRAPQLPNLRYSVLGLGDTSYEFFCQTGKDFDKRLEELGGHRIADRVDCDVDFDEAAGEWIEKVLLALGQGQADLLSEVKAIDSGALASESEFSRTNPFQAEVLQNLNLNGRGSQRETRHVELSLEGSNLHYQPGDSLGIYPENHPRLVDELIEALGWNAQELVPVSKSGDQQLLRNALLRHFEITVLTKPLLAQITELTGSPSLAILQSAGHEQELRDYLADRDLLDLVVDHSLIGVTAQQLVPLLRKIPARLYSIASSLQSNPDEVHITVRTVRYDLQGRDRYGVCSVQLAERLESGESIPVYIQHNPNFKLPEDPNTPIIMIGPGTGVAPFRAFIGEREETGAQGKSWLFYGDQHFSTDFLYQTEWQHWLKEGALTRMDVAFSRDRDQKVYVQHRMLEKAKELYQWLQEGAALYVCGDEKKMAHDVHAALVTILEQEGNLSPEAAADYLTQLQQQKRYQRDVY